MSNRIELKGHTIVDGEVEGEALVSHSPVSFLGTVNTETGNFDFEGHELEGRNIKGKILIYPFGKGSSGDAIRMWRLDKFDTSPAGILFDRAEPIHTQGAMLLNVPSAFGFERPIHEIVKTGDRVHIKGNTVIVTPQD